MIFIHWVLLLQMSLLSAHEERWPSTDSAATLNELKTNTEIDMNQKGEPKVFIKSKGLKQLSLEQSIQLALEDATAVQKARRDSEYAGTTVLQSYMQFLPNLVAQGAYNQTKGKTFFTAATPTIVNGKSFGPNYSVSTTLNIFNGFSDVAAWKAADKRRAAADKTLERTRQQISLDIAQSFLQVILDKKIILIADKYLKASKAREKLLEQQTEVGVRAKSDLFRQQAQASSDEAYLIQAQNKAKTDAIILLKKLRISPDEPYEFIDINLDSEVLKIKSEFAAVQEQQAIDQALAHRLDYQVSQLNAQATAHDVTQARSYFFPKIDLVATYLASARYFDYQYVNGNSVTPAAQRPLSDQLHDQNSTLFGAVLTWNIFDRWVTPMNVERAKTAAFKAELDSRDFRNQVIGEVQQALNDYRSGYQQLEASERGLKAAQRAYEVSRGKYEVGALSYVDLALAQSMLVQAEATRAQALTNFYMQKRAYDFALGTMPLPVADKL